MTHNNENDNSPLGEMAGAPQGRGDGGTAFPNSADNGWAKGMSLRQYAAISAMQGLLAGGIIISAQGNEFVIDEAIKHTDALLIKLGVQ